MDRNDGNGAGKWYNVEVSIFKDTPGPPDLQYLFVTLSRLLRLEEKDDPNPGTIHAKPLVTEPENAKDYGPWMFARLHPDQLQQVAEWAVERFEKDTGKRGVVSGHLNVSEASPELVKQFEKGEKEIEERLEEQEREKALCTCRKKNGIEQQSGHNGEDRNQPQGQQATSSGGGRHRKPWWKIRRDRRRQQRMKKQNARDTAGR